MKIWMWSLLSLLLCGCAPASPPALSVAAVQEFVREYFNACNAGDASKIMELISHEASVTSLSEATIDRGWDAIRATTDSQIPEASRTHYTVGTVLVTPLAPDVALAVAPVYFRFPANQQVAETPGAVTIVVRRTPEGLRLIHEHYSARLQ